MVEKRVYSGWAFSTNEKEKAEMNYQIYKEICGRYKISTSSYKCNLDDYDLVIDRTAGYNHAEYHIVKNNTNLSQDELALVCDRGNLCFGYDKYHTQHGTNFYDFED